MELSCLLLHRLTTWLLLRVELDVDVVDGADETFDRGAAVDSIGVVTASYYQVGLVFRSNS